VAEDAVSAAIVKSQEYRTQKTPITEHQQKLWRELAESFKQDDYVLIRPAAVDAGRAAVKAMVEEAEKLMTHPSVKKAFDHFILVCELTKEHE
jgi:ATP phosphoribosyltransferase